MIRFYHTNSNRDLQENLKFLNQQNLKFLNAKLQISKLQDLVKLETAAFVYNYKSGQLQSTFRNHFTALKNIHVKPTRATSSHNFFVPFFKTLKLQRSIKYRGPKIWNSLDLEIKNLNL